MNLGLYKSLMASGTATLLDANGLVRDLPAPAVPGYDWLNHAVVAMAMAGGKEVPLTIDTLVYFNRAANIPAIFAGDLLTATPTGEQFVDYAAEGFTYDRRATFPGCVTYFPAYGVPAPITSSIMDAVFGGQDPPNIDTAIEAAARQADDARRVNTWFHDLSAGIVAWDAPGEDTCESQADALNAPPTVTWTTLPDVLQQTEPATLVGRITNPLTGSYVPAVRPSLIVDAPTAFTAVDEVVATANGSPVTFVLDEGNLVGTWGSSFYMGAGFTGTVTVLATLSDTAPIGDYDVTLALEDVSGTPAAWSPVRTTGTVSALAAGPYAVWSTVPTTITQGTAAELRLRARNPVAFDTAVDSAAFRLVVDAPTPFTSTSQFAVTSAAGTFAFTLDPTTGDLTSTGPDGGFPMPIGHDQTTILGITIPVGAPTGTYTLTLELLGLPVPADLGELTALVADIETLSTDTATLAVVAPSSTGDGGGGGGGGGTTPPTTPPEEETGVGGEVVAAPDFDDVPATYTHREAIVNAYLWRLMFGVDDTHFAPNEPLSRGQVATIMTRLMERAQLTLADDGDVFTDDQGTTHERNTNRLANAGLISGFEDGTFRPGDSVTRGQLAALLVRSHEHVTGQAMDRDRDRDQDRLRDCIGTTHEEAIRKAEQAGFVFGYPDGDFRPNEPVTRAQMASMLMRMVDDLVAGGHLAPLA